MSDRKGRGKGQPGRTVAAKIAGASAVGLLVAIGLCGSHPGGMIGAGTLEDRSWAEIGTYLGVVSLAGLAAAFCFAIFGGEGE